ncbi:protein of unknown function [Serratia sp. Tan611]|nr:protein of unknown function [Serratia sp. Tan611]
MLIIISPSRNKSIVVMFYGGLRKKMHGVVQVKNRG